MLEGTARGLLSSLLEAGLIPKPDHVAQGLIQFGCENLQRWRCHSISEPLF